MLFENSSSIQSFQISRKKASARHIHHHLFPVIGPKMHFFWQPQKNISREALQNQVPVYNVYPKQCAFRQTHPLSQTVQKYSKCSKTITFLLALISSKCPNIPKQWFSCSDVQWKVQKYSSINDILLAPRCTRQLKNIQNIHWHKTN